MTPIQKIAIRADYAEKRRNTYPSIEDQLDALWKGGNEAEKMRARIERVKERYPKPADEKPRKKK